MSIKTLFPLVAALALSACGGTSPETAITCRTVDAINIGFAGGGEDVFLIRKGVVIEDPAMVSPVPGNNLEVTLSVFDGASFDAAGICFGSATECTGAAAFDNVATGETDQDGYLEYYLRVAAPAGTFSQQGTVTESFSNPIGECETQYTVTGT